MYPVFYVVLYVRRVKVRLGKVRLVSVRLG